MAKRTEDIHLRLTPEEKQKLMVLATTAGLTLTEFLISCALGDQLGKALKNRKAR